MTVPEVKVTRVLDTRLCQVKSVFIKPLAWVQAV